MTVPITLRRRGVALLYLSVAMVALIAISSLAVDLGRGWGVKAELQLAADSAARYGAAGLATGPSQARSNAVAAASDNSADGASVALDRNQDVELGTWNPSDGTFTALGPSADSSATAVRVTVRRTAARGNATPLMFARVVGKSAVDLQARAVARVTRRSPGIVGLDSISLSGNATNSYRSSGGAYGDGTPLDHHGTIRTNGWVKMSGGAVVDGDAYTGPGQPVSMSGGSNVTGTIGTLPAPLSYPAGDAGTVARTNDNANIPSGYLNPRRDLTVGSNVTLPGGVYYVNDFTVSSNNYLTFSGPATLYVTGSVNLGGGVLTYGYRPANLNITVIGSGNVSITGGGFLFADIYAPESTFSMSGSSVLLGSVIAKTVSMSGSAMVVFDEELGTSAAVSLVR